MLGARDLWRSALFPLQDLTLILAGPSITLGGPYNPLTGPQIPPPGPWTPLPSPQTPLASKGTDGWTDAQITLIIPPVS